MTGAKTETVEDVYPKIERVYINKRLIAELQQKESDAYWSTFQTHYAEFDRFPPVAIAPHPCGEKAWGTTLDEALDAIYREVEVQAPGLLAAAIDGGVVGKEAYPVKYAFVDYKGVRQEYEICRLRIHKATKHWATYRHEFHISAKRGGYSNSTRRVTIPIRLWGRDFKDAVRNVLAYLDGLLDEQERIGAEHVDNLLGNMLTSASK